MHYISKVVLSMLLVFPFPDVLQAAEQSVVIEQMVSDSVQQSSGNPIQSISKKSRVKKRQKKSLTRRQKWARGVGIAGGGSIVLAGFAFLGFCLYCASISFRG